MPTDVLFAGIPTADLDAAAAWYATVLGRPADIVVNDDEVMWRICDGGWLYVVRDPGRAGHALVAITVADLDRAVADLADRGLPPPTIELAGEAGRKARVIDPEGNTVALIEVVAVGQ